MFCSRVVPFTRAGSFSRGPGTAEKKKKHQKASLQLKGKFSARLPEMPESRLTGRAEIFPRNHVNRESPVSQASDF